MNCVDDVLLFQCLPPMLPSRFLWPTYTDEASNYHVLLIALIVSVKQREHLPIWGMASHIQVSARQSQY